MKTRAITGRLVSFNGEHVEYSELHKAIQDAQLLSRVTGQEIVVVDGRTDAVVAFI